MRGSNDNTIGLSDAESTLIAGGGTSYGAPSTTHAVEKSRGIRIETPGDVMTPKEKLQDPPTTEKIQKPKEDCDVFCEQTPVFGRPKPQSVSSRVVDMVFRVAMGISMLFYVLSAWVLLATHFTSQALPLFLENVVLFVGKSFVALL